MQKLCADAKNLSMRLLHYIDLKSAVFCQKMDKFPDISVSTLSLFCDALNKSHNFGPRGHYSRKNRADNGRAHKILHKSQGAAARPVPVPAPAPCTSPALSCAQRTAAAKFLLPCRAAPPLPCRHIHTRHSCPGPYRQAAACHSSGKAEIISLNISGVALSARSVCELYSHRSGVSRQRSGTLAR